MISIEVILPVYNEVGVLENCVSEVLRFFETHNEVLLNRIVIADNGSTDGTQELGRRIAIGEPTVVYARILKKGRGAALRQCWSETQAEFSLYMDVDLSTRLTAVSQVVHQFKDGADFVVGSRLHPSATVERSIKREFLSRSYNVLLHWILGAESFDDAQCGFKAIRTSAVRRLLPHIENNDWFFDTELLVVAEQAGLDIRSIPVEWVEDQDSKVRILSTVIQDLKGIARLRFGMSEIRELHGAMRERAPRHSRPLEREVFATSSLDS